MTNHLHLLFQVGTDEALPAVMHWLSTKFVRHFNRGQRRCGHLWQGRFFSTALDEAHLWHALHHVERNRLRARFVRRPWSAARCGRQVVLECDRAEAEYD